MPLQMYMTIEGTTQGVMSQGASGPESIGALNQDSHKDQITVIELDGKVFIPTDPQSGQPTGSRVHEAMKITKMFDKSSPMLYQALATNESLKKVELLAYRTAASGVKEHYYTITLEKATITQIRSWMPNTKDDLMKGYTHHEDIYISYKAISWTHEVAGTSGSDDWEVAA